MYEESKQPYLMELKERRELEKWIEFKERHEAEQEAKMSLGVGKVGSMAVQRDSEVIRAMNEINSAIDRSESLVNTLSEKLVPVLSQPHPEPGETNKREQPDAPLASTMRHLSDRVDNITGVLQDLIERIEL